MYQGHKIIAFIPARGGSKGVRRKNIRELAGKPLIAYTILAALKSRYIDQTMVSTEDEEIAETARKYGAQVPMLRPKELARDETPTIDVVLHGLHAFFDSKECDSLILLQPTQPLRTAEDIDGAIEQYYENGKKSLVSVSEAEDHPVLMRYLEPSGKMKRFLNISSSVRRQEMKKIYRVNGAIYINQTAELNRETSLNDNETGYLMEKSHSVDIDELPDFALAEYYLKEQADKIAEEWRKKDEFRI